MIWYGWLGLGALVVNEALLPWQVDPLARWFTPVMWTAYILLADALVFRWRGASLLHDRPREALFMATVSIPLWLVFELYNQRLQNWAYFGLPERLWLRGLGYAWSFATITPGLWQTAALLEAGGVFAGARGPARSTVDQGRVPARRVPNHSPPGPPHLGGDAPRLTPLLKLSAGVGTLFLVVPPLVPAAVRPWTFGFVWLGWVLLLDPLNYRAGRPSFTGAWARGDRGLAYRWLLAGLVCGVLWEFWNYWALARWEYIGVPVFPAWKVLEMPLAGYLGFPPFALGAFAMYHFVRPLGRFPAERRS